MYQMVHPLFLYCLLASFWGCLFGFVFLLSLGIVFDLVFVQY